MPALILGLSKQWFFCPSLACECFLNQSSDHRSLIPSFFVQALGGKEDLFPRGDYSKPVSRSAPKLTDQTVRTFVAILLSGTPAAVNQLVVTQLYNPEGTAHTLASFLMLQCEFVSLIPVHHLVADVRDRHSHASIVYRSRCDSSVCNGTIYAMNFMPSTLLVHGCNVV